MRNLFVVITLPLLLSGCVAAAVGAGTETGVALAEERSVGSKIDDSVIYTDINNRFIQKGTNNLYVKATVRVRLGRVMLTGIVPTQDMAQQAVSLAWQANGVKEVINELIVSPTDTISNTANDLAIKKNLESRLLFTKDVWVINYSLDVVNGTAYLLGRTKDRAELNRVMNVARTTKGVKRVVNHLQVKNELPDAVPETSGYSAPASTPAYTAPATGSNAAPVNDPYAPVIPGSGGPTNGTISTDSVSSSTLPPANGGY